MSNAQIGGRIRTLREEKKLTVKELAARAGVSEKYIYEIERGRKSFSVKTLCRLARALSTSCDYIMFGGERTDRPPEETRILHVLDAMDDDRILRMRELIELFRDAADLL